MVLTVTLNPAIDKTVYVENLKEGELNRVKKVRVDPGGKGINVSKALSSYGIEQKATGILAGMNGRYLLSLLDIYNFEKAFMMVPGETRVNVKINDTNTHSVTEFNEPGPKILKNDVGEFLKLLEEYLYNCDLMVLSGSLLEGIPPDFYSKCIKLASSMKVRSILDADGEAFKLGCGAVPFAIKPNLLELERLIGKSFSDYSEIKHEIVKMQQDGIELILVSLGKEGSIIGYKNKTYHAFPLPINVKSTVGAGDAMVAALAYCIQNDISADETARITSAAGTLTVALKGSEMADWKDIKNLFEKVKIEEI